jgi:hypothetical protein
VIRSIERPPHCGHVVAHRRRGVGLHHQHRLDRPLGVCPQPRLHCIGIDRRALVGDHHLHIQAVERGHLAPEAGEHPTLEYQQVIAARERVGQRHRPGAVAVADGDETRAARPGQCRQPLVDLVGDGQQLAGIQVGHRPVHCRQHSIGDDRGPRNGDDLGSGSE